MPSRELATLGRGKGALTSRGLLRQGRILTVAANLFSERGYDSVSVDDIGITAGVTGPAIYRYFPGKEALLVAIFDHVIQRNADGLAAVLAAGGTPQEILEGLLDQLITMAVEEAVKIRIVSSEERHLPLEAAESYKAETRRQLRVCTDIIRKVRPDLSRDELDVTVHAVLALINSITLKRGTDPIPNRVRERLRTMALNAIMAGA